MGLTENYKWAGDIHASFFHEASKSIEHAFKETMKLYKPKKPHLILEEPFDIFKNTMYI